MKHKIKLIITASLLFSLYWNTAFALSASFVLSKPGAQISVSDLFTIIVKVNSTDEAINAVSGSITFSSDIIKINSISKSHSLVNLWTREPSITGRDRVSFEGIILNPGYTGSGGNIFEITFEAKNSGSANISLSEGAILANDGMGTNILGSLSSIGLNIKNISPTEGVYINESNKPVALPVITDYSKSVLSKDVVYVRGKGEPNALTKIAFEDTSSKSLGERFIEYLETKKKKLTDVLVKNDQTGEFTYTSYSNLIAGAYNATPYLVDPNKNIEKPGLGVQLLVSDSKLVHYIVILINVLGLLIPVVALLVIIYFIPWYSWLRMRILKKKMGLEEEKLELSEHALKRQDKVLDRSQETQIIDSLGPKDSTNSL